MKLLVATICYNQAHILPFWLRYYSALADEIWVSDDRSTDGSRDLLKACPKVTQLFDWPLRTGIDEDAFLQHAYHTMVLAADHGFDWMIWPDTDEFVFGTRLRKTLYECPSDIIRTCGFNMTGDGLPKDDGRQLTELLQTGVRAPVYSKPIVFRPQVKVRWDRGKHHLAPESEGRVSERCLLKLLHYRYLGADYTRSGNARNYARCGLVNGDKGAAWSCAPEYRGADKEGSPEWAEFAKTKAFNVIEAELYD